MDKLDDGRVPEEAVSKLLGGDLPMKDVMTVWRILDVKKRVLTPSLLLV
jgi:hypothetical protein